jgi:hypothetical protein
MKPTEVREIEWICSKKNMVEMAISILNEADTMYCGKNVRDAVRLLEAEVVALDEELQKLMD